MASEGRVIPTEVRLHCFIYVLQVSFMEAQRWTREIIDFGGSCSYIILLGNKSDLSNDLRAVPYEV